MRQHWRNPRIQSLSISIVSAVIGSAFTISVGILGIALSTTVVTPFIWGCCFGPIFTAVINITILIALHVVLLVMNSDIDATPLGCYSNTLLSTFLGAASSGFGAVITFAALRVFGGLLDLDLFGIVLSLCSGVVTSVLVLVFAGFVIYKRAQMQGLLPAFEP